MARCRRFTRVVDRSGKIGGETISLLPGEGGKITTILENENEFLTRERPKKKREVKPKYLEEEREIYIPPSARNS